ncbi:hypothetical protein [Streptomyces sp. HNM0574]|uniref:hypothetical protein n=1 Tax=Streptomyces sp. HNM0574 TaxID=2714954 RepID=UPI00146AB4A5|nr:hypothetical protein [Streptomyces sp. HNM0574]NLU66796.1 hypothetical protein [Streptomyces sp. HNM0574]
MADDRYKWLDDDAAERLLRGVPVDARGDAPRINARSPGASAYPGYVTPDGGGAGAVVEAGASAEDRLAAALGELTPRLDVAESAGAPGASGAELPGEDAAVAAYRAAHVVPDVPAAAVGGLRARVHRRGEARRRPSLAGRPLKAGFAMAVAGCALGGVAMAGSAGVLPAPFGGKGRPASVSPLASPGATEEESVLGDASLLPEDPDATDSRDGSDGATGRGRGESSGTGDPDRRGGGSGRDGQESTGPSEDIAGGDLGRRPGSPGSSTGSGESDDGRIPGGDRTALAKALCTAYEEEKLSAEQRRKLEQAAGGRKSVKRYCAAVDSGNVSTGGTTGGSSSGGSSGGGSGSGGGHVPAPGDSGGTGEAPSTGGGGFTDGGSGGDTASGGSGSGSGGSGTTGSGSGDSGTSDGGHTTDGGRAPDDGDGQHRDGATSGSGTSGSGADSSGTDGGTEAGQGGTGGGTGGADESGARDGA